MVVQPSKDAPSIPSKRFPPYEHSGRPEDRVGPNEYEPNKQFVKKHDREVDFGKSIFK